MILFALIIAYGIVTVAARCFAEWFTARFFFKHNIYSNMILLTNAIAWTVLWILGFSPLLIPGFMNAWMPVGNLILRTAVTEVIVFLCKYLIYSKRMFDCSNKQCLIYTVVAGAASMLVSVLIGVLSSMLLALMVS